jgi:ornithine cyclodeaminase/alanine dehydrogenase-like protein (mu-crystallin family)
MAIMISDDDVRQHLGMAECIEAMRVAFRDYALGKAKTLPRSRYRVETPDPDRQYFANVHLGAVPSYGMACVRAGSQCIMKDSTTPGRKVVSNPEPVNWSVIILYDLATAEPVAFLHESYLSGFRVGATTGAAVDAIARDDVSELGLFGTGRQARANCLAICTARSIKRVRVFSPTQAHREGFAAEIDLPNVEIVPVDNPRAVIEGADIVCCATNTTKPLFDGDWLEDGQMVISIVNTDVTAKRSEVDERTFERASAIIVNDWKSVESNGQIELLEPIEKGLVRREDVHELGSLFADQVSVRQAPDRIIYFKNNTGLGMQFAAAGAVVYNKMKGLETNRVIPRDWLASEKYSQS